MSSHFVGCFTFSVVSFIAHKGWLFKIIFMKSNLPLGLLVLWMSQMRHHSPVHSMTVYLCVLF